MEHEHYLAAVPEYDEELHALVPHADHFFEIVLSYIPEQTGRVLELGSGTGNLTSRILSFLDPAEYLGIDKSPEMIRVAAGKPELKRVRFIEGDITEMRPAGPFDLVITTLTLHHLTGEQRNDLLRWISSILTPEGVFICGDVFTGSESWIEERYRQRWIEHMTRSGLPQAAKERAVAGRTHAVRTMETIEGFRKKLVKSGFGRVLVPYTDEMVAVHLAWKTAT